MNDSIIPFIIFIIIFMAFWGKLNTFDLFVDGVKEGLNTVLHLFPILLGLFLAINLLRASGIINLLSVIFNPIFSFFEIPGELIGLILLKPFSGSASLAISTNIMEEYGVNSLITFVAAIIMGATETIIYSISIYTGNVKKKLSYKVLILAFLGNFIAIVLASFLGRFFY
ncbi:MAG: nucleoside recognition domain-containing protein [Clostridia bacterium]|nr:hypothetical protein [Clostridia bacterium]